MGLDNKDKDRRRSERVKRTLPAWYRCDADTFTRSVAFSVGEGGASIVTDEDIEPDRGVQVTLKLMGRMVTVPGTAVWKRPADDFSGRYLVGIRFCRDNSSDRRALERWHHLQKLREKMRPGYHRAC
ncbi:MAG: PilZ domain-containing protein [Vulcanimicrobiota bacterium]